MTPCFRGDHRISRVAPPRVSIRDSRDPLRKTRINQLAEELMPACYRDAERLVRNPITFKIAGQLYYAAGSIGANVAEGYSRASGKDRARYFEYSLGSTRETMSWYRSAVPVLGEAVVEERLDCLEEIRRMLSAIIPREREKTLNKGSGRTPGL